MRTLAAKPDRFPLLRRGQQSGDGLIAHRHIVEEPHKHGPGLDHDPTSACNLHCTGCWAAEYGHKLNLSLETIDSIVRQGKELGTYMYIYTGGEPSW